MSDLEVEGKEFMTVSWVEGVRLAVQVRQHRFEVDQPVAEGGQDTGVTSVELFMASLGTCIGYFAVRFCQRHHMPTAGLNVNLQWDYAEKPHRIGAVTVRVALPGDWNPDLKQKLHKVLDGCTIHQSLRSPPTINLILNVKETGS